MPPPRFRAKPKQVLPLWRKVPYDIVESLPFDIFIITIIIIDGIFFGIEWSTQIYDFMTELSFDVESYIVTAVFVIEVFLKWIAFNPRVYFKSPWNWVDFVVTVISVAIIIIQSEIAAKQAGAVVFFRLLRLLRFIRVVNKVRAIATKALVVDVRLPAARCIEALQRLKVQLGDTIPKKRKNADDDRVTHEDIMYIIDQIRDRSLYKIVFGAEDMGDEEMQAYLASTANVAMDDVQERRSMEINRRRSSNKSTEIQTTAANWVKTTSLSLSELVQTDDIDAKAIDAQIANLTSWDFDVFAMADLCHGHELVVCAYYTFSHYNLFQKFKIPQDIFLNFVRRIESGYRNNPYHNKTHATDVLQGSFCLLTQGSVGKILTDNEIFAVLLSAIVHDFEHPGVNNNYLAQVNHELALRYNDKAVLESHHIAAAFALTHADPSCNVFVGLSRDEYRALRTLMIDIVLATDMAAHFECVSIFTSKMADGGLNLEAPADRTLALKMLVHVADISNPGRNVKLAGQWTDNVMMEFFQQGDEERSRGLKISPFMDRSSTSIPKCQIGFIDFIVKPLQSAFASFLKQDAIKDASSEALANKIMENVQTNRDLWNQRKEAEDAAAAAATVASTSRTSLEGSQAPSPMPSSPALDNVRKTSLNSSRRGSINGTTSNNNNSNGAT